MARKILLSILLALLAWGASAQRVVKETYVYSVRGTDTLRLDRHYAERSEPGPAMIYMFGGGFVGGQRDGDQHESYFTHMAENGVDVYSIDYRLGLRSVAGQGGEMSETDFGMAFLKTLDMAVEDLFDATAFLLERADGWNIDPNLIIACGSSAGAVSVLHGQYAIANGSPRTAILPEGFDYAAIIAFAGAIFATDEGLAFQKEPCPVMLFHGDADSNVPYDEITGFGAGFYGSAYISGIYVENGWPCWFWDVENAAHEIAAMPMTENRPEILSFIDKFVLRNQPLQIHSKVSTIGRPGVKKEFTIDDYIRSNFAPRQSE